MKGIWAGCIAAMICAAMVVQSCSDQMTTGPSPSTDTTPGLSEVPYQPSLAAPTAGLILTIGSDELELRLNGILGGEKFGVAGLHCATDLDEVDLEFRDSESVHLKYNKALVRCAATPAGESEHSFRVGIPVSWDEIVAGSPSCLARRKSVERLDVWCSDEAVVETIDFTVVVFLDIDA